MPVEKNFDDIYTRFEPRSCVEVANSVYEQLLRLFGDAYNRMKEVSDAYGFPLSPSQMQLSFLLGRPDVLVTDRPLKIYGQEPFYSVTSSLALGSGLLPASYLRLNGIPTHRGICSDLSYTLLSGLGNISLENVDQFVWLGRKLDGEHDFIDKRIVLQRSLAERELISAIFDYPISSEEFRDKLWNIQLNPLLLRLFEMLKTNQDVESDPEMMNYVENLLRILNKWTGIRQRWYSELRDALTGKRNVTSYSDVAKFDHLEFQLRYALTKLEDYDKSGHLGRDHSIIIVEIDPARLFKQKGLYLVPLGIRPPFSIAGVEKVPLSAITAVYSNVRTNSAPSGFQVRPIDEIPDHVWLSRNGHPLKPGDIREDEMNPLKPVCDQRYTASLGSQYDNLSFWVDQVLRGNVMPNQAQPYRLKYSFNRSYSDKLMLGLIEKLIVEDRGISAAVADMGDPQKALWRVIDMLDQKSFGQTFFVLPI